MSEDHLSNEIAVAVEMTDTGLTGSAKSRAVSALDRFVGAIFDLPSSYLEGVADRQRARNEGERQLIDAAVKYGLDKLESDSDFAQRAFERHYSKVARLQVNKDATVAYALQDLREQPPIEDDSSSGPDTLSEPFLDRFERYAEEATTDELRAKWGRVLAAEIRKPGTFSGKVLRVIDELTPQTAALFEKLCRHQVRGFIVKALVGELSFKDAASLVTADLLLEPSLGQVLYAKVGTASDGMDYWLWNLGVYSISLDVAGGLPNAGDIFNNNGGKPSLIVYVLTEVGRAITTILPDRSLVTPIRIAESVSKAIPHREVRLWKASSTGELEQVSSFGGNEETRST